jgi:polyhydroxybutyrate depolymerase
MALARSNLVVYFMAAAMMQLVPRVSQAAQQPLTINIEGRPRDYILVTPNSLPAGTRPLVLVLHGHIGTAANALGAGLDPSPLSAWLDIAERERIYVAALQGLKGADKRTGWHDCRSDDVNNTDADDVAFAAAVVQELVADGRADPRRIYVMGMSNGAMMSYRLALEMHPVPTAIAAVSGTMALHTDCAAPTHPVSVLIIHGTDDPLVPYTGGSVGFRRGKTSAVVGVEATRDFWLRVDGLQHVVPAIHAFSHIGTGDTSAASATYGPDSGPQVELLTVQHGGHVEPSLRYHYGLLYSHVVGAQSRDLESAEEAWKFFGGKVSR